MDGDFASFDALAQATFKTKLVSALDGIDDD